MDGRSFASDRVGRGLALVVGSGVVIAAAGCGGSTAPAAPSFAATTATVQSALSRFTSGTVMVPPTCSGSVTFNCPGGVAGSPVGLNVTASGTTITQAAPHIFDFASDLAIVSQSPLTVTSNGVDCGVAINTAGGTSPTVHLSGTATFSSQTAGGPIDRLDLVTSITNAEAADVTITGDVACQVIASSINLFEPALASALTNQSTHLCAGPGGTVTTCS